MTCAVVTRATLCAEVEVGRLVPGTRLHLQRPAVSAQLGLLSPASGCHPPSPPQLLGLASPRRDVHTVITDLLRWPDWAKRGVRWASLRLVAGSHQSDAFDGVGDLVPGSGGARHGERKEGMEVKTRVL